ncbi:hypothetical protein [Cellulomonas fimi]|uniref:Uncharacterized protein n=1 Tax=Cellulomonas fimi TaxID=1708 RepID=A0A7Y0M054_CELFI|nr:hypothetical protein [Cellulomonas fimi]NMR21340.1 hypothetical protein [Cellulomonas fimi]
MISQDPPARLRALRARAGHGDDWRGTPQGDRLEHELAPLGVEIVHFSATVHASGTALRTALAAIEGERPDLETVAT